MLIINDRQLIEDVFNYDTVLVPMGINNSMNRGFPYEVKLNFPEVYEAEKTTGYCDTRKYGSVTFAKTQGPEFALCYTMLPSNRKRADMDYVNYKALSECMTTVNVKCKGTKVASLIMGVYKGRGNSDKVIDIMTKHLTDVELTLYTLEPRHFPLEIFHKIAELHKMLVEKTLSPKEFLRERSKVEWVRRNGIYKEMPEDYSYIPKTIKIED